MSAVSIRKLPEVRYAPLFNPNMCFDGDIIADISITWTRHLTHIWKPDLNNGMINSGFSHFWPMSFYDFPGICNHWSDSDRFANETFRPIQELVHWK